MTDKELKKLSKADLLSLLLTQSKEMDRLKEELAETRKQLEDRSILLEKSGSLADASLAIFHVLEDAQKAADLYLENVRSGRYQKDEVPQEDEETVSGQEAEQAPEAGQTPEAEQSSEAENTLDKSASSQAETSGRKDSYRCGHFRESVKAVR